MIRLFRFLVFLFAFLFSCSAFSQDENKAQLPQMLLNADYRIPVSKASINRCGKGLMLEAQIGFGKQTKFYLLGGFVTQGKLSNGKFTSEFAEDYNHDLNTGSTSGRDSAGLVIFGDDMNRMHGWAFPLPSYHEGYHESIFYFGLTIALPKKLPVLKFYHGVVRGTGSSDSPSIIYSPCAEGYTNDGANHFTSRPLTWGASVTFRHPLFWIKSVSNTYLDFLTLSFYYEARDFSRTKYQFRDGCSMDSAKLYLRDFTSAAFIGKYKNEIQFGFRIGIMISEEDM
jgi:hypothetical protein